VIYNTKAMILRSGTEQERHPIPLQSYFPSHSILECKMLGGYPSEKPKCSLKALRYKLHHLSVELFPSPSRLRCMVFR